MSMDSANTALADLPEQRPMKSIFPQNHNANTQENVSELPAQEVSNLLPMREREKTTDRFARDINAKIDALEEQLGRSATTMERSQEMVKAALEELRDRIMGVRIDTNERLETNRDEIKANRVEVETQREELKINRAEILANRDEIRVQSHEIKAHHAEIEAHRDAIMTGHEQLKSQLGELNSQRESIQTHRLEIDSHGNTLAAQTTAIATHKDTLASHHAHLQAHTDQITLLDDQHVDLQQVVKGLSQEHDATVAKVDTLADQLYVVNIDASAHRHQTQKSFRLLTGALVGTSVLTLSLFTYFQFNPIAAPAAVETQLSALSTGLDQQRLATASMSGEIQRIGSGLTIVEGTVSQLGSDQASMQAVSTTEINQLKSKLGSFEAAINDLRARIQRSVGARAPLPVPALPLHDGRWLASRPSGHYVIQLVGVHEYDSVVRFVNANANVIGNNPVSYSVGSHLGKDWHNVMLGDFASLSDAQAALAGLPPALQTNRPWIRKMGTVQKKVRG